MSISKTYTVLDRSIPVGTWTKGEVLDLRNGDQIVSNGGPFKAKGKVLNITSDVIQRLLARKRIVEG